MSIQCTRTPGAARSPARPRRRLGVVLLLVLMVVALGSSLSMRFLHVATLRATTSHNLLDSKRAESLAESGIAEAAYWLSHPELTGGTYWTGVSGRKLDASADNYTVTVVRNATNTRKYAVTSLGQAFDAAGQSMSRTIRAEFLAMSGFPDAICTPGDLYLPSNVSVIGDVYAYNKLDNAGYIDGNVAVGRTFLNAGTITGGTTLNAPYRSIGSYSVNDPVFYWLQSNFYWAQSILLDSIANQTLSTSQTNPMGVHWRNGSLNVYGTNKIQGTLVVSGSLYLRANSSLTITPKPGYPALVLRDDLILAGDRFKAVFNGTVIINDHVHSFGSMPNSSLKIHGALVFPDWGSNFDTALSTDARIVIEHDPAATDVSEFYSSQPNWIAGMQQTVYCQD